MELSGAVLALAGGATPLRVESALFEEMLAGWRRQQTSRRLGASLIDRRERTVRRFQAFANLYGGRSCQGAREVAPSNFCAGDLIICFLFPGKPCGAVERSRGQGRCFP